MSRDTAYARLSALLFVVVTAIVLLTFRDYGASWDELFQHQYGEAVLRYYTSFFKDRSSFMIADLYHYGAFFEVLSVLATRILPLGLYEARHLMSALCGIAGILACWKTVRLVAGPAAAFWSAFLLTLYPAYYGHMFINSKDIPFAVLYMWSLYYLIRMLRELPGASLKTAVKLGLACGLTMAVRVGGVILICYLYLFAAIFFAYSRSMPRRIVVSLAVTTLTAYSLMLLFWPYGLSKPFVRPYESLKWFSNVKPAASSRDYIPKFLVLKLPELILLLAAVGLCLGIRELLTQRAAKHFQVRLPCFLLTFASLFPVIYAMITRPFLYDEIRHFLFIIPPLFCLAGVTLNRVVEWAGGKGWTGKLVYMSLSLYFLLHIRLMAQLHPYEYSYYNRFIGGVYGAYRAGYVPEYWATSYKEGVEKLKQYLADRDGPEFEKGQYRILAGPAEWCATYYFPHNFILVTDETDADIYLSTTRDKSEARHAGLEVVAVRRFEAPFVIGKTLK